MIDLVMSYQANPEAESIAQLEDDLVDGKAVGRTLGICIRGVWRLVARGELAPSG